MSPSRSERSARRRAPSAPAGSMRQAPGTPMPGRCIRGLNAPVRSAPSDVAPAMWRRTCRLAIA